MSILHFGHLNRLFRDDPRISHLDSKIVNISQVTPEDLTVQLTGVGVGKGLVRGSRKSSFTDREAPSGKYSTFENKLTPTKKMSVGNAQFCLQLEVFLLTVELFYLQLPILACLLAIGAFLLTALAFLLTIGAFLLTVRKCV